MPQNFHLTDKQRGEIARAEFVDLPTVAEKFGLSVADVKTVRRNARKKFNLTKPRPERKSHQRGFSPHHYTSAERELIQRAEVGELEAIAVRLGRTFSAVRNERLRIRSAITSGEDWRVPPGQRYAPEAVPKRVLPFARPSWFVEDLRQLTKGAV